MPGMITLQPDQQVEMEGLLDRLKNGAGLLRLLNSGLVTEALDIVRLVPDGKYGEAIVDIGDILVIEGMLIEGEAVRALGMAMIPRPFNWTAIIPPACKFEELVLLRMVDKFMHPTMGARVDLKDASRVVMQKWVQDNTAGIRDAKNRPGIRRILERWAPDVLKAMNGDAQEMNLTPEQADKIIKLIGYAIIFCTVLGAAYPPAAPACVLITTILRAVQVSLKSRFPEISALPDFTPDGTERGLEFTDLTVLA
jgi:hypothetical protein